MLQEIEETTGVIVVITFFIGGISIGGSWPPDLPSGYACDIEAI